MYLHFEDWSPFLGQLNRRGIPHGGKIIKVYPTEEDPRKVFRKETLTVIQSPEEPFSESYDFGERGVYTGMDLERYLEKRSLTELGKRVTRALFRFAASPEYGFTQRAMAATRDGKWHINHPIQDIDSLSYAKTEGREMNTHLDIFFGPSLEALRQIVDYNTPEQIISLGERREFERAKLIDSEGMNKPADKERY